MMHLGAYGRHPLLVLACFATLSAATEIEIDVCGECQETPDSLSLLQTSLYLVGGVSGKAEEMQGHNQSHRKAEEPGHIDLAEVSPEVTMDSMDSTLRTFPKALIAVIILALGNIVFLAFAWDGEHSRGLADKTLNLKADLREPVYSYYDRFFLRHRNEEFGKSSERAFRCACVMCIYALPFYIPSGTLPVMDGLLAMGLYSKFIGQQLLFNYQWSVGATIQSAAQLTSGTFLAVLTIWLMLGVYPTGVSNDIDGHVYKAGILCGGSFYLAVIWLNFPMKLKIFSLLRFSEYLMDFLNPTKNVAETYSVGFQIHFEGTAMKAFVSCLLGGSLAMMACLFPHPHLAITDAERDCFKAVGLLKGGWKTFYGFMKQPRKRSDMMSLMQRELFHIKETLDNCDASIKIAWWECLGMGPRQKKRLILSEVHKFSCEMYVDLLGAYQCVTADDTFAEEHSKFMDRVEVIESLIDLAGESLYSVCKCIEKPPQKEEKAEDDSVRRRLSVTQTGLTTLANSTRDAVAALTTDFFAAKRDFRLPPVSEELLEEHVFCRCVCVFGRKTSELASSVRDFSAGERAMTTSYNGPVISSVFDLLAIFSQENIQLACRLTATFFIGFLIAYFGFGTVLIPYNTLIPGTMAMLISKGKGLQLTKNLMRLQGVVIGMAVGSLLHAFVGGCGIWSGIYSITSLMIWIWVSKVGHQSRKDYAYLCFLLALFGQNQMVTSCSGQATANFTQVVFGVVVAIATMTAVDMLAPTTAASHEAADIVVEAWDALEGAIDRVFKVDSPKRERKGEIVNLIQKSYALNAEAVMEPRFWKTPWREQSFLQCVATIRLMRSSLHTVEDCMYSLDDDRVFAGIVKSKSFRTLLKLVQDKMEKEKALMDVFRHEQTSDIPALNCATTEQTHNEFQDVMKKCAAEASREALKVDPSKPLSCDSAAKLCHIIACFDSMRTAMTHFQSTVVANG